MLLGKDFISNFEEESEEDKATLDDLVTGAILRPKINGSDPRPPVLITDDYRRKWDTLQFSAALPIGKHALMKTKDLSTTEFDESRLTKETIVRPSYFGLEDGTDRFSIRIDVNIGNMIPQENGSID